MKKPEEEVEKNIKELADSWAFLESELDNFKKICEELERGKRVNIQDQIRRNLEQGDKLLKQ